jgi:hypothetical protein
VHSAKVQIDCSSLEPLLRRRAAAADALEVALAAQGHSAQGDDTPTSRKRSRPKKQHENRGSSSRRNDSSSGDYVSVDVTADYPTGEVPHDESEGGEIDDEKEDSGDYGAGIRRNCSPCGVAWPWARQSIERRRAHLAALDEEVAGLQGQWKMNKEEGERMERPTLGL